MDDQLLDILQFGEIEVKGEFLWGSNYTFLTQVTHPNGQLAAVYKPSKGERPLWDFPPSSLAKREAAAYLISEMIGWKMVPPTVYRQEAPFGAGSLQLFINHDPEYHYFRFRHEDLQKLGPVVLFDVIINNADRKGSHLLFDEDGQLWLIDHGVCFHTQDKLRTVVWDFAGKPIPENLIETMKTFHAKFNHREGKKSVVSEALTDYLSAFEIRAMASRIERLIEDGCYPAPDPERRHFPWPQL